MAGGDGDLDLGELVGVVAAFAEVADADGIAEGAFDGVGEGHAAEGGLDGAHDLFGGEAEAGEFGGVEADLGVGFAAFALHLDVGGAGGGLDDLLGFFGEALEGVGVVAEDLEGDEAADAGGEHDDAGLDGLEPARGDAGDVGDGGEGGADLGEGAGAGAFGAVGVGEGVDGPLGVGFEEDDGLDHAEGGGVEGGFGASHFSHDAGDLGDGFDEAVLREHDALGFAETAGGGDGRHEEEATLVEGREKTGADAGEGAGEGLVEGGVREIGADEGEGLAEGPAEGWPAEAEEVAAEREGGDHDGEGDLVALEVIIGPLVGDVDGVAGGIFLVVDEFLAAEAPDDEGDGGGEKRGEEPAGEGERPAAVVDREAPAVADEPAEGEAAGETGEGEEDRFADVPRREEEAAEDGDEEGAEEDGAADCERFGEGERGEEAAGLVLEGEDREEADDGGGGGGEEGAGDFLGGGDDGLRDLGVEGRRGHGAARAAAFLLQIDEMLRDIFRHDDAEIDHHADGDGDAGEAHDVGADAGEAHDEKGEEHAERQAEGDGEAGADVEEKRDDDDGGGDDGFDEGGGEGGGGFADELGAIVERDDGDLFAGEGGGEGGERAFHGVDHALGILADAQADDGADVFLIAVGEEALAELAAEGDGGDVAEAEASAEGAVAAEDDVFDVGDGADEAGAADHGFDAGLFDAHGADVAAGGAHGHHEHVEGEALFLEAGGFDVDLVFADDAAGGGDLGDAGDGAEGGDDDLVEEVAFGFEVARALEGEGVDLAHGGGIGAEAGVDAGREEAAQLREAFEDAGAALVEIAALLEDDVEVTRAVEGHAADGLDAGETLEFAGEAGGDLLVHVLRALAGPLGPDDDLVVAEVGERIHGDLTPCPQAGEREGERGGEGQEGVADAEGDHGR